MAFKDNFRGDSAYTQIMTKIFNIFWLSILWLLCCIPVITIGASTIALYYVMLKLVKDEETTVTREFFHSFKQNFLQSLPVTVIVLVVVVVLVADFHILGAAGRAQGASFMYGFCIVLGIICAAVFSYVFPLLAKFENTNPEDKNAWTLALELAKKVDADIILATDPDADRLGVHAKDTKTGEYVSFTGNMSGMLIAEYILRERTKTGTMPENPALVETIVTTDMAKAVAKEYNTALIEVLTGFKYIGEQIRLFDETGSHQYVFGLEESYGCLAGTYARDKDAPVAVMMLCEVAAYYKLQGKTLWDAMVELYEKYGYYKEDLATVTLKGIDGSQKITAMMNAFRENPPKELGGFKVLACRDYKSDCRRDMITGETTSTGLPTSNVLYYELENNAWCCVRPSGTEPKIKYYFGVKGENFKDAEEKLEALKKAMTE